MNETSRSATDPLRFARLATIQLNVKLPRVHAKPAFSRNNLATASAFTFSWGRQRKRCGKCILIITTTPDIRAVVSCEGVTARECRRSLARPSFKGIKQHRRRLCDPGYPSTNLIMSYVLVKVRPLHSYCYHLVVRSLST